MKLTLAIAALIVMAGCASVKAQNDPNPTGILMHGGKGETACVGCILIPAYLDDGKPPRWVESLVVDDKDIPEGMGDCHTAFPNDPKSYVVQCDKTYYAKKIIPAHWECDKGYELDGLEVAWPNGIFTPRPARCNAVEKK